MTEPSNIVLQLLRDIRADMATKDDLKELKSDVNSFRADVASDILSLHGKIDKTKKDVSDEIVGLRRAVVEYHSAVIGHGVIVSDLEARVRRIEQNLGLF